jgi:hypothetical protein
MIKLSDYIFSIMAIRNYFRNNMSVQVLLVTPPFTQLNTPYPATAYLKGFLNTKGISSFQIDLGIEVILELFSKNGLENLFNEILSGTKFSSNAERIVSMKQSYINCIDSVIQFLQGKHPTFANRIIQADYLPRASRFNQLDDLAWAFGTMGIVFRRFIRFN